MILISNTLQNLTTRSLKSRDFIFRSSPLEGLLGKSALKTCSTFTRERTCRSVISIKLQSNFKVFKFYRNKISQILQIDSFLIILSGTNLCEIDQNLLKLRNLISVKIRFLRADLSNKFR